jgi:hypothetical protein
MNAKGITEITYWTDLGNTPARVNRVTGELQINMKVWETLSKEQRFFVLLHEWAHVYLQTTDEKAADKLAFEQYAKRGYSLNSSVLALSRLLNFNKDEDYERADLQLHRAKKYDFLYYGNKNIYKH